MLNKRTILLLLIFLTIILLIGLSFNNSFEIKGENRTQERITLDDSQKAIEVKPVKITAKITGYNSDSEQTDDTPCYAGSEYICGRDDVVACPRSIPKGTWVKIEGKMYECVDQLAIKYDHRFDVFCDQDYECPYEITGWKEVIIYLSEI